MIFGSKDKNSISLSHEEMVKRVMAAAHELSSLLHEHERRLLAKSFGTEMISHHVGFSFTRIWMLAAAFGLLTVVPLVLVSQQYPWAIIAVIGVGAACTAAIEFLATRKQEKG